MVLFFTSFSVMMQQIVPQFTERRALFEAREGPSKMFSWSAFLLSAIITEVVGQTLLSALALALFHYPTGMFLNIPAEEGSERAARMFLFFLMFLLFTSTCSHQLTVGMDHRETIMNIGALLIHLILIFCGVLAAYDELPKFWTFMYWLSPLKYQFYAHTFRSTSCDSSLCQRAFSAAVHAETSDLLHPVVMDFR
jgi:ABC-type multidrug transport system permease subunit